jgi:hypothetical protein
LIDQQHHSNLFDARSYRGAKADSDHYLVIAQLRYRIAQRNNKKIRKAPLKHNRESLATNKIKQEYINKLVNRVQEMDKNNLIWAVLHQIVINTADEVIGKDERVVRNGWFNEECTEATKIKNEAYSKMIQRHKTRGHMENKIQ